MSTCGQSLGDSSGTCQNLSISKVCASLLSARFWLCGLCNMSFNELQVVHEIENMSSAQLYSSRPSFVFELAV